MDNNKTIAVYTESETLRKKAMELAKHLNLPITEDPEKYDYLLNLTPLHISIISNTQNFKPFYIDFASEALLYRQKKASLRQELLAKAMGLKMNLHPKILDATGGLGRDSFILATLGFEIIMTERSPIIFTLLEDGLRRAWDNPDLKNIAKRIQLIEGDAQAYLKSLSETDYPDITYLDPMFPERKKSAMPKKEMRIFQELLGPDKDVEDLLKTALACTKNRVVVKRPRLASPISERAPSFSLDGSSNRFDIYLVKDIHGHTS